MPRGVSRAKPVRIGRCSAPIFGARGSSTLVGLKGSPSNLIAMACGAMRRPDLPHVSTGLHATCARCSMPLRDSIAELGQRLEEHGTQTSDSPSFLLYVYPP